MVQRLFHVNVNVTDFERSLEFYRRLGFRVALDLGETSGEELGVPLGLPANARARAALLILGDDPRATRIDLIEWREPKTEGRPYPTLNHTGICRIALRTRDIERVYRELRAQGVEFLSEPRLLPYPGGTAKFVCFRDPDGTVLELIEP
jgi:glyoxylase I family protein